jgi:hypothetical protein
MPPALDDWDLVIAMPAVALTAPVEASNDTAIVPHTDQRYENLIGRSAGVRRYLASFRTAFGGELHPSIVIRDHHAPPLQATDLVALRNMLALAVVTDGRIRRCVHSYDDGPSYSDLFEFYPVNVGRDGTNLIIESASEFGLASGFAGFRPQPHPAYIYPEHITPRPDLTLLSALLKLWRSSVRRGDGGAFRRRVFRSLEMAYHALASPFRHLGSDHDRAVGASLWVTAFEVLAKPATRNVVFTDVQSLITSVPWEEKRLLETLKPIEDRKPRPPKPGAAPPAALPRAIRPVHVYQRLYRIRNQTLHGGTVSLHFLSGGQAWNPLHVQVPALYRGVLLGVLASRGFHRFPPVPRRNTLMAWARRHAIVSQNYKPYEEPLFALCRRCRAFNKEGRACSRRAASSGRCWQHQDWRSGMAVVVGP